MVLLDVHIPGGNAPAVIAGVRKAGVETTFLALSVSDAAEDVIAVIRAGARGYVRGCTYKELGQRLHISVKTVESHASSVLRKLQLSNRHELSRWATDRHIV